MNIKNLQSAVLIYKEIQQLDIDIIEIEKFAMMVADGEKEASFELTLQDPVKPSDSADALEMRHTVAGAIESVFWSDFYTKVINSSMGIPDRPIKSLPKNIIKNKLSENATLLILGVLLGEKRDQRDKLLTRLNKLGVAL